MSDTDELDLDTNDSDGSEGVPKKKKSALASLLPNILKFVAIGLGALIVVITVVVITVNILNKNGRSQTTTLEASVYTTTREQYQWTDIIGEVRTTTSDPSPYAVVVDLVLGYTQNDAAAQTEIINRKFELRDKIRNHFRSKRAEDFKPELEDQLKQELINILNTQVLSSAKVRAVTFNTLTVSEM
ncbi:flagellar basal body protein FliL [Spirochaetia bacterium]|nr:flagellar basal body protein FliL [Spirochaetia bacterium]GHU29501.1 flagellar basal body protein FliL [Spirochaetia bacterium]